jgi:hypothetical protein
VSLTVRFGGNLGRMADMPSSPRLTRPALAAAGAALALPALLTGCGTGGSPESGTTSSTPPRAFPITITRSGGLAGFADRIVIQESGAVAVSTKSGQSTCTLAATVLEPLKQVAGQIAGTATATTAAHPDDMVIVVTTPQGSARLTDAQLSGAASAVNALLNEAGKQPADRTICR